MTATNNQPAGAKFLPGRSVLAYADAFNGRWDPGVVTDVDMAADREYTVRLNRDGSEHRLPESCLHATTPDRPRLAVGDFYAVALGEILAERAGPDALAGFHDGYNNGHIGFKEEAREILARLDARARKAAQARCWYTYVVDPDGVRREDRSAFEDGDRLIACPWFGDGPGASFCEPHTAMGRSGRRTSIFYATPDDFEVAPDAGRVGAVYLSPFVAPTAEVTVAAVRDAIEGAGR
jgi:hypothetical protein